MPQPPQQQQGYDTTSFRQRIERMEWWAQFFALSLIVFRKNVGFRILNPFKLFVLAAFMMLLSLFFYQSARPQDLFLFAGFMFVAGICQRLKRWREMRNGRHLFHSYYVGDSVLEPLPFPPFCRSHRKLARIFEPTAYIFAGWVLVHFSPLLGTFVFFGGAGLRICEHSIRRREINENLDLMDSIITGEIQTSMIEQFQESTYQNPQAKNESPGIPTGTGEDIQEQINRKQSKRVPPHV